MHIHFINKEISDISFSPNQVNEILKQIKEGADYIALYDGDAPYFACKVSQINYIA